MSINSSTAADTASGSAVLILLGRILLSVMFILVRLLQADRDRRHRRLFRQPWPAGPTVVAILVGLLELFGGLAVLVGFQTRIAAIALAIFTLAATAIAHLDFADQMQVLMLMKNLGDRRRLPGAGRFRPGRAVTRRQARLTRPNLSFFDAARMNSGPFSFADNVSMH